MCNVRKTCEDCGNKDICRYVKDLDSTIKRIEAISEDSNLLLVDICCKRWRTTETLTRLVANTCVPDCYVPSDDSPTLSRKTPFDIKGGNN